MLFCCQVLVTVEGLSQELLHTRPVIRFVQCFIHPFTSVGERRSEEPMRIGVL